MLNFGLFLFISSIFSFVIGLILTFYKKFNRIGVKVVFFSLIAFFTSLIILFFGLVFSGASFGGGH